MALHKRVSSKCTLFVLEAARRGDEGCPRLFGAGGVGYNYKKSTINISKNTCTPM